MANNYIDAIFENEDVCSLVENNQDTINFISENVYMFGEYLKQFIAENAEEFIEPTIEDTRKNIRVFSEVATAQYIKEQVGLYGTSIADQHIQQLSENSIDSYL